MNFRKIASVLALISVCLLPANAFGQDNQSIDLAGKGISARLHAPIANELGMKTNFVRISEDGLDFSNENSELLIIGTSPEKHINHILNSIDKYEKILCEKPVGISADDCVRLEKAIKNCKTQIRVNYQLRFHPKFKEISDFIKQNRIRSLKISYKSDFGSAKAAQDWKNDIKTGGGVVYSLLPHIIDAVNFVGLNMDPELISWIETTDENNIPMRNVRLCVNLEEDDEKFFVLIDLDVSKKYDEFTFRFETEDGNEKIFDLIANNEVFSKNRQYANGYLLSKNDYSFWRRCFKDLLETFLNNPSDYRLATIADAKKVLLVTDEILQILILESEKGIQV